MANNWLLSQIKAGMSVVDVNGEVVGTVKAVYFGGDTEEMVAKDPYNRDTFVENLAEVFAATPDLPETLRNRLQHEGFVEVDRALAIDPYILPDQIQMVEGNTVTLRAEKDELITR